MQHPAGYPDNRHDELLNAVRKLPDIDRQLVVLYLEGLSAQEISDIVGLSANNVAVRLHRARGKLTQTLRPAEARHEPF